MENRNLKKTIYILAAALVLVLAMLAAGFAAPAFAASQATNDSEWEVEYFVNPIYEDVADEALISEEEQALRDYIESEEAGSTKSMGSKGRFEAKEYNASQPATKELTYFETIDDAVDYAIDQLIKHNTYVSINVKETGMEFNDLYMAFYDKIAEDRGNPKGGSYLRYSNHGFGMGYSRGKVEGVPCDCMYIRFTYLYDEEQDAELDAACEELLDSLELNGLSNYDKLSKIYRYVCDNVVYDYDNLNNSDYILKFSAYAALINKTAVCQGYANLMYRLLVECGIDTRIVDGPDHAWNMVEMEGKYYFIDATWDANFKGYYFMRCKNKFDEDHFLLDADTISSSYDLADSDYVNSHKHTMSDATLVREAGCKSKGLMVAHCTGCDYFDNIITPAKGHNYPDEDIYTIDEEPKCVDAGVKSIHCLDCGQKINLKAIRPTGHELVGRDGKPATCTEEGYTYSAYCSKCNEEVIPKEVIAPKGHSIIDFVEVGATCFEDGLTAGRGCRDCDYEEIPREVIPAKGHDIAESPRVEPTCYSDGRTRGVWCKRCYEIMENAVPIKTEGHIFEDVEAIEPTCTEVGYTAGSRCTRCGTYSVLPKAVMPTGHKEVKDPGKEATCIEEGLTDGSHCSVCKKIRKKQQVIPKTSHNYEAVVDVQATAKAEGSLNYVCSVCGKEKYDSPKVIEKIGKVKLDKTNMTYSGKYLKPAVTVTDSSGSVIDASNYSVKYANNKNVGKATVTIKFKNLYSGSKKLTFKINPKTTPVTKVTPTSKAFTVTWSKRTAQVTGYEVQYSTSKTFKNGSATKTVTIKSNKTVSKKIKSLKAKKTYYVRVRTYKSVNGVKYYSAWSAKKKVVTK